MNEREREKERERWGGGGANKRKTINGATHGKQLRGRTETKTNYCVLKILRSWVKTKALK